MISDEEHFDNLAAHRDVDERNRRRFIGDPHANEQSSSGARERQPVNFRELLISTMDLLATKTIGLVVEHRGYVMKLCPQKGGSWCAVAMADIDDGDAEVVGSGLTPIAALDRCAEAIRIAEEV